MMNRVIFDELDSYEDLNLILKDKTISTPSIKTATINIPGSDGILDLSEYFGEIKYDNRRLEFEFSTIIPKQNFLELYSEIQNKLHGKLMKIILTDDPGFYYYGRVAVNEWKSNKRIGTIAIEVNAEPYKYKNTLTTISNIIEGTKIINCFNLKKPVVPTITSNGEINVSFNNYNTTFSGERTDDNILFKEGYNTITITCNTSTLVTIVYQERGL